MMKKYLLTPIVCLLLVFLLAHTSADAQDDGTERMLKISSTEGDIVVILYNETPGHRDNMIKLIESGFYNDQLFHRVIKDFMIQGGDPHSTGAEKGQRLGLGGPGYDLPAEFDQNLIHKKGALAAAREGDRNNPEKASSGSQFYMVQGRVLSLKEIDILAQNGVASLTEEHAEVYTTQGGTPHLDGSYTVFGEIVSGLDILDSIASRSIDAYNRPLEDVIYSISVVR
jgi:cyclophilin family peptidyl-prolyl cis-trans isomerase